MDEDKTNRRGKYSIKDMISRKDLILMYRTWHYRLSYKTQVSIFVTLSVIIGFILFMFVVLGISLLL